MFEIHYRVDGGEVKIESVGSFRVGERFLKTLYPSPVYKLEIVKRVHVIKS